MYPLTLRSPNVGRNKESEIAQSCQTIWDTVGCSLPGSSVHGIFPGKNTGVGCHFLLQRIFQTRGWNPSRLRLLHCRQIEYSCLENSMDRGAWRATFYGVSKSQTLWATNISLLFTTELWWKPELIEMLGTLSKDKKYSTPSTGSGTWS